MSSLTMIDSGDPQQSQATEAKRGIGMRLRDCWAPALLIVLVVAGWRLFLTEGTRERAVAIEAAEASQRNVALAVANHTAQLIERVRMYGFLLSNDAGSDQNIRDGVRRALVQEAGILQLMLVEGDGTSLFSTGREAGDWLLDAARKRIAAPDRGDHEAVPLMAPSSEQSAIGRLPLLHVIDGDRALPPRSLVALLDLSDFPFLFGDMDLGETGEIELADRQGQVLMRIRHRALALDGSIASTQRLHQASSPHAPDAGTLVEFDATGEARHFAYRRVEGSPLTVFVGQARSEILATARAHQQDRTHWLMLLTVIGSGLALSRFRTIRRQWRMATELTVAQGANAQLQKQVESERQSVYRLATYDKLTGLPNRMLFADLSSRYISRAKRTNTRFAVMFIDLDRFKPINDTYGHLAGDKVLIEIARRLQACVREVDVISRHGGDEFVALLSDLRSRQDVASVAGKIIESLSAPITGIVDTDLAVTPSIGISFFPDDAHQIDELVRQADTAMYAAKGKGRATFAFSDPELNRRMALSNEIIVALPTALAEGEIELHYQPKVRLDDFSICGLEALARWTNVRMGSVSPVDFIPAAEKSGIIVEIGAYVIRHACKQLAAWRDAGLPVVPVAVNVSWLQLMESDFFDFIVCTLAEFDLPPAWLELEITETGLVQAEGTLLDTLHRLRAHGLHLAIDDFGTGYSGLSKLRSLPARYVKIDKSFIQNIRTDTHDAAIVSNTVSLSHSLGLVAIAEGVESAKQVAHLRAIGCDQAQGYFFSRPCDAARTGELLRQQQIAFTLELA